jgi:hypothetical protein
MANGSVSRATQTTRASPDFALHGATPAGQVDETDAANRALVSQTGRLGRVFDLDVVMLDPKGFAEVPRQRLDSEALRCVVSSSQVVDA